MISIAIVEDNPYHLSELENSILRYGMNHSYKFEIDAFMSQEDCQQQELKEGMYDLYFIDLEIENDRQYGVQLAKMIREDNPNTTIVFMTTLSEAMPFIFKNHIEAYDFIAKDIGQEAITARVNEALEYVIKKRKGNLGNKKNILSYSYNGRKGVNIPFKDICAIQTDSNISHGIIIIGEGFRECIYGSISEIYELDKDKCLTKVNRSLLVNFEKIESTNIKEKVVYFSNGDSCRVTYEQIKKINRKR
ncbi:two component transcriptional regulator, LytTR family [Granulicatella balaenopterae]|uniref:Two component transcriptional regulator, LytTR family n=1 Tax=Granulicatella balaenopterae TaxID=137733 RepID=A0A1H9PU32_9LACT|nr:LytTR family DNA-binding domain-containing protein [Granulicatella balaenopterae]SER51355.1 two component transcriptional regulator, LytTR family [Granulicatella balaenopterae]